MIVVIRIQLSQRGLRRRVRLADMASRASQSRLFCINRLPPISNAVDDYLDF